jgi:hypothetical protein
MSTQSLTHPLFHIIPCTKDLYHVYFISGVDLDEDLEKKLESTIPEFKENGLGTRDKPLKMNTIQLNKVLSETNKIMQEFSMKYESSDSEDDDDDEETIQHVISRRIKRTSKYEIIDSETIDHSDDENNITLSRRLRYILKELKQLKQLK